MTVLDNRSRVVKCVTPTFSVSLRLGALLGRGGEGSVYATEALSPLPSGVGPLVVKLFHQAVLEDSSMVERAVKLQTMVLSQPASDAVCWPVAVVCDPLVGDKVIGLAMPAVDLGSAVPFLALANVAERQKRSAQFSFLYALRVCQNLGAAIASVHAANAVLGDLNESNVFVVADASVIVIDCDSAQITDPKTNRVFRCRVGKMEFSAPELVGLAFAETDRSMASDVFAFAVLAFQMLTGGCHPFDGKPVSLDQDVPSMPSRIAKSLSPYLFPDSAKAAGVLPVGRVPFLALPAHLVPLFVASCGPNPFERPSLIEWVEALAVVESFVVECGKGHHYDRRDGRCGWCAHVESGCEDTWATVSKVQQRPLPPVVFSTPHVTRPQVVSQTKPVSLVSQMVSSSGLVSSPLVQPSVLPSPKMVSARSWPQLTVLHPITVFHHCAAKFAVVRLLVPDENTRVESSLAALAAVVSWVLSVCVAFVLVCWFPPFAFSYALPSLSGVWLLKARFVLRVVCAFGVGVGCLFYPAVVAVSSRPALGRLRRWSLKDTIRQLVFPVLGLILATCSVLVGVAVAVTKVVSNYSRRY